jgi:hypothetical protein
MNKQEGADIDEMAARPRTLSGLRGPPKLALILDEMLRPLKLA